MHSRTYIYRRRSVPIVLLLKKGAENSHPSSRPLPPVDRFLSRSQIKTKTKQKQFSLLRLFQFLPLALLCVCLRFNEWNNSSWNVITITPETWNIPINNFSASVRKKKGMGLDGRPKQKYEKNKFDTHKKKVKWKASQTGMCGWAEKAFWSFRRCAHCVASCFIVTSSWNICISSSQLVLCLFHFLFLNINFSDERSMRTPHFCEISTHVQRSRKETFFNKGKDLDGSGGRRHTPLPKIWQHLQT